MKNIPTVDLSDFTSGNSVRKQNFVTALGDAYREVGFVTVKNHGINESLIEELYREVKERSCRSAWLYIIWPRTCEG